MSAGSPSKQWAPECRSRGNDNLPEPIRSRPSPPRLRLRKEHRPVPTAALLSEMSTGSPKNQRITLGPDPGPLQLISRTVGSRSSTSPSCAWPPCLRSRGWLFVTSQVCDEPLHEPLRIGLGMPYRRIGLRRLMTNLLAFVNDPAKAALALGVFLNFDREGMSVGHLIIVGLASNRSEGKNRTGAHEDDTERRVRAVLALMERASAPSRRRHAQGSRPASLSSAN